MKTSIISVLDRICKYSFLIAVFVLPFSKALTEIFIASTILSWFCHRLGIGNFAGSKKYVFVIFGLFIIFSSLSAFGSGYPLIAMRGMLKLLKFVLMAFILLELVKNARWLKWLLYAAFASFAFILLDSLVQFFVGFDLVRAFSYQRGNFKVRLTGPFISYGLLAAFLIAAIPILVSFVFIQKKWINRIVLSVFTFLSAFLLYHTHSRSAWIASAIALFVFSFLIRKRGLQIALIVFLVLAPFVFPHYALIHLDITNKEQSLVERYYLWDRAIQVIRAKPLFGCGINTFTRNYPKYDQTKNWRVSGYPVHNGFLQTAAESGLIALALFLAIIGMALKSGWRVFSIRKGQISLLAAGLLTGFIALLCQGFADTTFHNPQSGLLLWLFIGILISMDQWNIH